MKIINADEYLKTKSYIGFIYKKIKRGEVWRFCENFINNISRYTFITRFIRVVGFIFSIIEKSAVLIFIATTMFLALPILILSLIIYTLICIAKFILNYKQINEFIQNKKNITIIITKVNIISKSGYNLTRKFINELASKNENGVILVSCDRFISVKWQSKNILVVKEYCFFVLKRLLAKKNRLNLTCIAL